MALCYVFGFVLLLTSMNPGSTEGWSSLQKLEFILERGTLFQLWNIVIYVVFGAALVVLSAVLHRLMHEQGSFFLSFVTPFGYIWAGLVMASGMIASVGLTAVADLHQTDPQGAAQLWSTLSVVQNGLGGGVEVVGGLWVLLISLGSIRSGRVCSMALNGLGLIVGVTGVATIVPAWTFLGAVFGMTQILWFIGLSLALARTGEDR